MLSSHVSELLAVLQCPGLAPLRDAVVTSAAISYEKPHPAAFQHPLTTIVSATEAWTVTDNSIAHVQGGTAAGLPTILVCREHTGALRQP